MTDGERCMALAYLVVSLFGCGMAFVTVTQMSDGDILERSLTLYERWVVLSGGIGGGVGLFLAGEKMGQQGARGHLRAIPAVIWVSFVGALIAGTLALPLYGTMFGPFTLGVTLAGAPVLAALWFANLFGAHVLIAAWRAERAVNAGQTIIDQSVRVGRTA
jgi:hypothetical protein